MLSDLRMVLISSPENKPLCDVPIDDVPLNDVPLGNVRPDDVPLGDIYVRIDDVPPDDAPLDSEPLGEVPPDDAPPDDVPLDDVPLDEPLGEVPSDDAPPDDVPLDDVIDSSIVCLGAFPMAGCLINAFLGEKIFNSCCDNSTINTIMQASNRNFKAHFPLVKKVSDMLKWFIVFWNAV